MRSRHHRQNRRSFTAAPSGYALSTRSPYRMAMDQKVDFVEQDLAVSKDGILVCLHDDSLERTSNAEEVFPRSRQCPTGSRGAAAGQPAQTLARQRLHAGRDSPARLWRLVQPEIAGERIVTWQEAIDLVKARPGLGMYPELKSPPLYTSRGVDMMKIFVESVKKNGLDRPESLRSTPVIIQSFDEATIRRAATELPTIPRVFLTSSEADVTDARLRELKTFATGIAPQKTVIARVPDMAARATRRASPSPRDVRDRRRRLPDRARRDVALSLHAWHRCAVHEQPPTSSRARSSSRPF
jgi:glycerophosphoryl diester phosphodiesterase